MTNTVLIIDDEKDIVEFISYNLISQGFKVISAYNGKDGLKKAIKEIPDLILLDVMMPGMDGFETCSEIRKIKKLENSIVVFLSAKNEDVSQIQAFDVGANDYIIKNIKTKLLIKKINGLLQLKSSKPEAKIKEVKPSELIIDNDSFVITYEDKVLTFSKKEFDLISLLYSDTKKVFKREEILERVWGSNVIVGDRTIDVHVRRLREKLGDHKIITVKGVGYKYSLKE